VPVPSSGVYKKWWLKKCNWTTGLLTLVKYLDETYHTMSIAPFLIGLRKAYSPYLQKMNNYLLYTIFLQLYLSMLTKRIQQYRNNRSRDRHVVRVDWLFLPHSTILRINEYHFLGIVFCLLILLMMLIGKNKTKRRSLHTEDVKLWIWHLGNIQNGGIILLLIVFAIYLLLISQVLN